MNKMFQLRNSDGRYQSYAIIQTATQESASIYELDMNATPPILVIDLIIMVSRE